MAGFICDLCGGQITMQANKTGVCKECGMEYDLEAIRAKMGAASKPVSTPAPVASVAVQSSDEVDREALITYLNDVRVMETIVKQSKEKLLKMDEKIRATEQIYRELDATPPSLTLVPEPEAPDSKMLFWGIGSAILGLIMLFLPLIFKFVGVIFAIFGISVFIIYLTDYKKYKEEYPIYKSKMQVEKEKYEESLKQHEKASISRNWGLAELRKKKSDASTGLNADMYEINKLLKKAYSANIIPVQFRNIQGVYYLYDYLSTSNQTLSEALMQCNLEAIKQKLDKMIQLQSEQIVQQAVTNAKLGKIYEVSVDTMNNTAVAAKYAQIAAVNSEVTKKLAASSLAYQKADFWLK